MRHYIELSYKSPHFSGIDVVKATSIINAIQKLDAKLTEDLKNNPHMNSYEIKDLKITYRRKGK